MAKIYGDEEGDKEQWAKLKGRPLSEKLQHFITYYGLRTLAIGAGIFAAIYILVTFIHSRWPVTVAGEFLMTPMYEEAVMDMHAYLTDKMELNPKRSRTDITNTVVPEDSGMDISAVLQKTFARLAVGDIDFLGQPEVESFDKYMDPESKDFCAFEDLRVVLDEETYEFLEGEGRLLWFTLDDGTTFPYVINVSGTLFSRYFGLIGDEYYIGYTVAAEHPDGFRMMCRYLFVDFKLPDAE